MHLVDYKKITVAKSSFTPLLNQCFFFLISTHPWNKHPRNKNILFLIWDDFIDWILSWSAVPTKHCRRLMFKQRRILWHFEYTDVKHKSSYWKNHIYFHVRFRVIFYKYHTALALLKFEIFRVPIKSM